MLPRGTKERRCFKCFSVFYGSQSLILPSRSGKNGSPAYWRRKLFEQQIRPVRWVVNKWLRSDFLSARVLMGWISGSCSQPGSAVNLEWENLLIRVLSSMSFLNEIPTSSHDIRYRKAGIFGQSTLVWPLVGAGKNRSRINLLIVTENSVLWIWEVV